MYLQAIINLDMNMDRLMRGQKKITINQNEFQNLCPPKTSVRTKQFSLVFALTICMAA